MLFDKIDWLKSVTEEYQYFHQLLYVFVQALTEKGKSEEAIKYLGYYKDVIQGKSINYLNYCSLNSYFYWFISDYKQAIEWAERGIDLQKSSDIGLEIDLKHKLALALRDSKDQNNLHKALNIMLQGENLENVLSKDFAQENFSSSFFGNIGRCLWLQKKSKEAVICYYKSYILLIQERKSNSVINRGYACLWIAEYCIDFSINETTLYFLKYCLICWEKEAPIKALKVRNDFEQIINDKSNSVFFATLTSWDVEKFCNQFVELGLKQVYI